MLRNITRRRFIKLAATATIAGIGHGCVSFLSEKPDSLRFNSNPCIPIPIYGCYFGWFSEINSTFVHPETRDNIVGLFDPKEEEEKMINSLKENYGKAPAIHCFCNELVKYDWFPSELSRGAHKAGVVPNVRWYFDKNWDKIARGELDGAITKVAEKIADVKNPILLVPYPEVNVGNYGTVHQNWKKSDPAYFPKAWDRMKTIFEKKGANKYTSWGLHFIPFGDFNVKRDMDSFKLNEDLVDWVGFSYYSLDKFDHTGSLSSMVVSGYIHAKNNYPSKPIALFELGRSNTIGQGSWIEDSFATVKKLPRIKLIQYWEVPFFRIPQKGVENTTIRDEYKDTVRKAVSDPYFLGAGTIPINRNVTKST